MEQRGIATERGDINRAIEITNQQIQELENRITKLQSWIIDQAEKSFSKTSEASTGAKLVEVVAPVNAHNLADMIRDTLAKKGQSSTFPRNTTPAKQESISKMMEFLQSQKIMDMNGLHDVVMTMHRKLNVVRDDLKRVEPKLKELAEHIKQAGRYREHSEIYKLYNRQKSKDKEQFYESFRMQLTLYESAKRHLAQHLNKKGAIPLPTWEKELKELTGEKKKLYWDYEYLKVQTVEAEKFKRLADEILREDMRNVQKVRSYDLGL